MAVLTGITVVGVLIVRKLVRLYQFFGEFRLARITPDQLRSKLVAGENILLLDLQGSEAHCQGLMGIPGYVRIDPHLLGLYQREYRNVNLSVDREVVLYCADPGERLSIRVALALRRRGFQRVRPLAGGLEAWRNCDFPVSRDIQMLPPQEHAVYVLRELLHYSPTNSAHALETSIADVDRLLEQAQERVGRSEDTRLVYTQHLRSEEVAQSMVSNPATGPHGQASMTE
jgi:rhodanese-related sulfurtransferase